METPPVPLFIIRHAEQERIGQDGPLTARGREQATALAAAVSIGADDVLVSSPLLRARQTAEAFGRRPEVYADLAEFRFGPSWDWAQAEDGGHLTLWRPTHGTEGGETLAEFQSRVVRAVGTSSPRHRVGGSSCAYTAA
jgi:broad specificity phosphatase PhoE